MVSKNGAPQMVRVEVGRWMSGSALIATKLRIKNENKPAEGYSSLFIGTRREGAKCVNQSGITSQSMPGFDIQVDLVNVFAD